MSSPQHFRNNPELFTLELEGWNGTPLLRDGRFVNLEFPGIPRFADVWKWQTSANPYKSEKKQDLFRLEVRDATAFLASSEDGMLWLGHASFFLRLGGIQLLVDPVLGSPSIFMPRYSSFPVHPDALQKIDLLLLTHDHRDHVDAPSLKLLRAQNPGMQILTGLGMQDVIGDWLKGLPVQEAGWFQRYQAKNHDLEIWYLPTRHWGRRLLADTNRRLWGAFLIRYQGTNIYLGGDSGYGGHYTQVRKLFGPVDTAMLGVGAYRPEWFMGSSHTAPDEAVRAAMDLGAKRLIPMHYGTFDLADESLGDPHRRLSQISSEGCPVQIYLAQPGEVIPPMA